MKIYKNKNPEEDKMTSQEIEAGKAEEMMYDDSYVTMPRMGSETDYDVEGNPINRHSEEDDMEEVVFEDVKGNEDRISDSYFDMKTMRTRLRKELKRDDNNAKFKADLEKLDEALKAVMVYL